MKGLPLSAHFAARDAALSVELPPTPVAAPELLCLNGSLAEELGLDPAQLSGPLLPFLAGNLVSPGSRPLAMAYAGHQFGGWVPQLGDGRAHLLGELSPPAGGRYELQLKGSGPTPFSRRGDGRAAVGPMLREYLISEAMHALKVPTTRSLAVLTTGEPVYRERPLPGAILCRLARSHIRVGSFEYFAAHGNREALSSLVDHAIESCYPALQERAPEQRPLALFHAVLERQLELVTRWQLVGFIHGVMNSDNCTLSGETIDYGPCAFMDHYDPDQVYSSIDHRGRYRYQNQPSIVCWNLRLLARAFLAIPEEDEAKRSLFEALQGAFEQAPEQLKQLFHKGLCEKLALDPAVEGAAALAEALLTLMAEERADFTLSFRVLSELGDEAGPEDERWWSLFGTREAPERWLSEWRTLIAQGGPKGEARRSLLAKRNPAFIPRNHKVEEVLEAANEGDIGPFKRLHELLQRPYEEQPDRTEYRAPPRPEEIVRYTFCGT